MNFLNNVELHETKMNPCSAHFGSTYTKTRMTHRRLAWPLCKVDMQIHEVFHIFKK